MGSRLLERWLRQPLTDKVPSPTSAGTRQALPLRGCLAARTRWVVCGGGGGGSPELRPLVWSRVLALCCAPPPLPPSSLTHVRPPRLPSWRFVCVTLKGEIERRHDIVDLFKGDAGLRGSLREGPLKSCPDLDTLKTKMQRRKAGLMEVRACFVLPCWFVA